MTSVATDAKQDLEGHHEHTKAADQVQPLPGRITRPVNVVFLGAGSFFCATLCKDIMAIEGNHGGELRLVDIDSARLQLMHGLIEKLIAEFGQTGRWSVTSSTERRDVLPGAHYAVCCVEISGLKCVQWDNDIPLKHGVDQCIGDTLGPGGLFKGLRTVPVFLDILRDMRELCPGALMLNYTNPMSMLCLAAGRAVPEVPVVGLCHSVQGTSHLLAEYAGIPYDELEWDCAGINHLAWFTRLRHRGEDLYTGVLNEKFRHEIAAGIAEAEAGKASHSHHETQEEAGCSYEYDDLVRKDMCLHFGAFITESSGHLSEYLPYYRKSDEGRKLLRLNYHGGSRFYAECWPKARRERDEHQQQILNAEKSFDLKRSWEYGSFIIEAMEKDAPFRIHGNVMNRSAMPGEAGKLITNLPGDACVEVACLVDGNGIQPTRYGALPPQMAHICASNMAFFDLAATACIEKSKEAALHALLLDPLCQAVLTPSQIQAMALEMFEAQEAYLPGYR